MKALFTSLIVILSAVSLAQTPLGKIEGIITDEDSKEVIIGATIKIVGTSIGAVSDVNGKFTISNLEPGIYKLTISFIGQESVNLSKVEVKRGEITRIGTIGLKTSAISLDEVVVSPGSYSIMDRVQSTNQLTFSEKSIKNMAWAEDITRSVARLPGISSSDYSSKFAIRGGEANEVLMSLDGMELLEPFHQRDYSGGLFSIVDMEAIKGIDLMTGGYAAQYGNRNSGVFNMRTKTAEDDSHHTSIGMSIMNARVYTDGKFAKNRGSYLFSVRRGMLDQTLKLIGNNEYFPKFYDGLTKVEYRLSDKHILSAHVLHSSDRAFINNSPEGEQFDQFDTRYSNTYTWLTLKSFFSTKLDTRTIVYYGDLNQDRNGGFDKYENSDKGYFGVADKRDYSYVGVKQDWNWETTEKFHLTFGYEAKHMNANYHHLDSISELRVNQNEQIYLYERSVDIQLSPRGEQVGSYVTARYKILPKLIAETGMRYDIATYTGDKNWSPRASVVYAFNKRTFARAGWGLYYQTQFINDLDLNNGIQTFNRAKLAKHYVLSLEHATQTGLSLRTEIYYKAYSKVSPLWQNLRDHLENYPEARNDNARVVFNGIIARGVEIFLKYDEGKKISWWFSYALAEALDDIKQIDFDGLLIKKTGKVPRLNNQYHTVYADINYRPSDKWHFNTSWQFYYGWPRTDYTYRYTYLPNNDIHFYQVHGEFNNTTYPAYHRLDIRVNRSFELKNSELTTFLHIINVYNRQNLKKFDLDAENDAGELSIDADGNYVPFEDNKYWLGLLPVIGIKWEFRK